MVACLFVCLQETVKRSPSRGSQESGPSPPGKKDSELEVILRRRRNKAGDAGSGGKNGKCVADVRALSNCLLSTFGY